MEETETTLGAAQQNTAEVTSKLELAETKLGEQQQITALLTEKLEETETTCDAEREKLSSTYEDQLRNKDAEIVRLKQTICRNKQKHDAELEASNASLKLALKPHAQ